MLELFLVTLARCTHEIKNRTEHTSGLEFNLNYSCATAPDLRLLRPLTLTKRTQHFYFIAFFALYPYVFPFAGQRIVTKNAVTTSPQ